MVLVEMLTNSLSFGSKGHLVIFQKFYNGLNVIVIIIEYRHVPV